VSSPRVPIDPDVGIPDLVRSLTDDSKRLMQDEVRLAKLELGDSVKRAGKGGLWLGLALGVGFVTMVAFTVFLAALIGRVVNRHYWLGALVTAVVELGLAVWCFKKGASAFAQTSFTMETTRESLKDTAHWAAHARDAAVPLTGGAASSDVRLEARAASERAPQLPIDTGR